MSDVAPTTSRWPKQIKYIIGNEACERFSYYGMTSILQGYITGKILDGGLARTDDYSTEVIHAFKSVNYFTPLLGAWLSDKFWGRYKTIFWVSLLYCVGHGTLACSDLFRSYPNGKLYCLFAGLTFIAFGSGGIKPCVSAFMGEQFDSLQSSLMQKAYGAFYWTINFGSFFSFLVIPWLHDHYGYSVAFGVPGILMAIATFIFWRGKKHYVFVPTTREKKHRGFFNVIGTTLFSSRAPGKTFWDAAREKFSESEVSAARSVLPILFVFALIPMFWALYDQCNSTWVAQARKMSAVNILGLDIGAEQMQSLNPLCIMLFVPIFTWVIYPRIGRFAAPLKRMSFGLFLAAFSFVLVAHVQKNIEAGEHLSVLAQTWQNIFLAAGEVLVSTTGLEFAFREAAPEMKSMIMSFWLVTVGVGNFLVVLLTKILSGGGGDSESASVSSGRFLLYAEMMFGVAIVFSIIAATYKYRDKAAAEGK